MSKHTATAITLVAMILSIATVVSILIFALSASFASREKTFVDAGYVQCVVQTPRYSPDTIWVLPPACPNGRMTIKEQ